MMFSLPLATSGTTEQPLPPPVETCLLEPASLQHLEPTFTGLDLDNSQKKGSEKGCEQTKMLTVEIEKLAQKTQKIQAVKEKKIA